MDQRSTRRARLPFGLVRAAAGLRHRAASTVLLLVIAVIAAAAAAAGPTYYDSARTSILRDTFADAPLTARQFEVVRQGSIAAQVANLLAEYDAALGSAVPNQTVRARLLAAPVLAVEGTAVYTRMQEAIPLVWRTGACEHLTFTSGRCPLSTDDVVVSTSLATRNGWSVGQHLHLVGWPTFTVTGIYAIPHYNADYWSARGSVYFPFEVNPPGLSGPDPADAMFTAKPTVDEAVRDPQGDVVIDQPLRFTDAVATDLDQIQALTSAATSADFQSYANAVASTSVPSVIGTVLDSWHTLRVAIVIITAELLLLIWVLMFVAVGRAIQARGPEIALAKLRGAHGFGLLLGTLTEPIVLLAAAVPIGVGVGVGATAALQSSILRTGTPVDVSWIAWAAAGGATVGGVIATIGAGGRTLRRGVVDQWQHASRDATRRTWIVDVIVITAALAATAELVLSGKITTGRQSALSLLLPALVGLLFAVLGSRLLPLGCRALFGPTARRGGLAPFLAVRQVARRAAEVSTAIVLVTAFALAEFAISAWSNGVANHRLVARFEVGADTVLDVEPVPGHDIGALVDRLDPGGTGAVAVDDLLSAAGGATMLAVDPSRFGHVAALPPDTSRASFERAMHTIAQRRAPTLPVTGSTLRARLDVIRLTGVPIAVFARLVSSADGSVTDVPLGILSRQAGPVTLTARVTGCPCVLDRLIAAEEDSKTSARLQASQATIGIAGLDTRTSAGWRPLDHVADVGQWQATSGIGGTIGTPAPEALTSTSSGLSWQVSLELGTSAQLISADLPRPPLVVADPTAASTGSSSRITVIGLDQNALDVDPVIVFPALPSTSPNAVVIDRSAAERDADGILGGLVVHEVWLTQAVAGRVTAGLRAHGVKVLQTRTSAGEAHGFDRQGPGLANSLFLADGILAAVLAGAAAVMSLATAAGRRRFEFAALGAAGATRRTLYASLVIEQAAVLVFSAVVGTAGGVVAALLAGGSVPDFVHTPPAPPLSNAPPVSVLAVWIGSVVIVLVAAALVASRVLLTGARPERLREAQP